MKTMQAILGAALVVASFSVAVAKLPPAPPMTDAQKADLKKKYSRAEMLNKADQVIYMRAFDISEHFRQNWKGTGFKAQLVAPSKAAALTYKKFLDEIFEVATSIAAISEGKLSDAYPASTMTRERIGILMGGVHGLTTAPEAAHAH